MRTGDHSDIPDNKKNSSTKDNVWEVIKFTIIALLIVIPIRIFVAQPFVVSGESMTPSFDNGDYLIIDEISYRFNEPKRGDVVVFRYPLQPNRFFIKRIIGLPGETMVFKDGTVSIKNEKFPQGFSINEPYVKKHATGNFSVTLKDNEYFVLGDNRNASSDSRVWGPLPESNIVGRAAVRLLPPGEISMLPGEYKISTNSLEE